MNAERQTYDREDIVDRIANQILKLLKWPNSFTSDSDVI